VKAGHQPDGLRQRVVIIVFITCVKPIAYRAKVRCTPILDRCPTRPWLAATYSRAESAMQVRSLTGFLLCLASMSAFLRVFAVETDMFRKAAECIEGSAEFSVATDLSAGDAGLYGCVDDWAQCDIEEPGNRRDQDTGDLCPACQESWSRTAHQDRRAGPTWFDDVCPWSRTKDVWISRPASIVLAKRRAAWPSQR
jgi:hypothetical protein